MAERDVQLNHFRNSGLHLFQSAGIPGLQEIAHPGPGLVEGHLIDISCTGNVADLTYFAEKIETGHQQQSDPCKSDNNQ